MAEYYDKKYDNIFTKFVSFVNIYINFGTMDISRYRYAKKRKIQEELVLFQDFKATLEV